MKLLLRTEGLPGAGVFTEIEREDAPDEILLRYDLPKGTSLFGIRKEEVHFIKVGCADGMPYYRRTGN